tara:strand:- start:952 stop:1731 length:780 start_codon:yes stop_codon:yes gene_type:complete
MIHSKSTNDDLIYCNILILLVFTCLYCYLKRDIKEGITNKHCCGGIEAGVHYSETDTKPPEYVRRCFKSEKGPDGATMYQWSGFPCTNKDDKNTCCDGGDDFGHGKCIPTSNGGYCDSDRGEFIFNRRDVDPVGYIEREEDEILDIQNVTDMKGYFYNKSDKPATNISPDMEKFMRNRSKNNRYIKKHLIKKNKNQIIQDRIKKDKGISDKQTDQLIACFGIIYLIFLLCAAIYNKKPIIQLINGFFILIKLKAVEAKN